MTTSPRRSSRPTRAVALAGFLCIAIVSLSACAGSTAAGGVAGVTGRPSVAAVAASAAVRATAPPTPTTDSDSPAPPRHQRPRDTGADTNPDAEARPGDEPLSEGRLRQPGDEGPVRQRGDADHAQRHRRDRRPLGQTQARIAALAESLSEAREGTTEPLGWARGLEKLGGGKYAVVVAPTRGKAIERAVRAIRATGRPAGLLVWRGAHSWVLHGYESTADPAGPGAMTVTHLYVSDPWYPRISSIWGPSRGPNARITPKQLEEDFLQWRRPTGRYPGMDGQYVLILPVAG